MITNVYEIFVASFNDSNNDRIGDLNGITLKLDYIKDMGYDALWLMPIHPSSSYHKYNVDDYYDIDPKYGTIEDFKNLINEAHKRNIKIIIDLVINHTAHTHPWFVESFNAHLYNDVNNKYYNYYNFSEQYKEGYVNVSGLYYEARFGSYMPDLNLDSVEVRNEISNIIKYYNDLGVDGYRLDAVTSYYTNKFEKNSEFLSFLRSVSEDKYIVGEAWTHLDELKHYYNSFGSLFSFYLADALILSIRLQNGEYLKLYLDNLKEISNNTPLATFLGNHDTNRSASMIEAKFPNRVKFQYGLCSLIPGTLFSYYGDEIGMIGESNDPNRRIPIIWDDKSDLLVPRGTTEVRYQFKGVNEQLLDSYSILNYYKKINNFRLNNKEIFNNCFNVSLSNNKHIIIFDYNNGYKAYANLSEIRETINLNNEEIIETFDIKDNSIIDNNILYINGYSIVILKNHEVK